MANLCFVGVPRRVLGEERKRRIRGANRKREDGDVNGAGSEAVEEDRCNFFDYGELNLRKFLGKRSRTRGRRYGATVGMRRRLPSRDRALLFDDFAASGFEFAQNSTGAGKKCLPTSVRRTERPRRSKRRAPSSSSSLRIC